jgi:hypothetical protein
MNHNHTSMTKQSLRTIRDRVGQYMNAVDTHDLIEGRRHQRMVDRMIDERDQRIRQLELELANANAQVYELRGNPVTPVKGSPSRLATYDEAGSDPGEQDEQEQDTKRMELYLQCKALGFENADRLLASAIATRYLI